jgi:hypothetical protein
MYISKCGVAFFFKRKLKGDSSHGNSEKESFQQEGRGKEAGCQEGSGEEAGQEGCEEASQEGCEEEVTEG